MEKNGYSINVKKEENCGKIPVLISACLLGVSCKYNGGHNRMEHLDELKERCELIPVCPEQMGGLATPRCPAEIRRIQLNTGENTESCAEKVSAKDENMESCAEMVITKDGTDVTAQYEKGAREALYLAQLFGCRCAILKARSPSCGSGEIYDGTFSKTLAAGDGKAAGLLKANGVRVYTELEFERFRSEILSQKQ